MLAKVTYVHTFWVIVYLFIYFLNELSSKTSQLRLDLYSAYVDNVFLGVYTKNRLHRIGQDRSFEH